MALAASPAVPTPLPEPSAVPLDALARHHGAGRLPLATAMYLGAGLARVVAEAHDHGRVLGRLDANRVRCTRDGKIIIAADGGSFMAPETKRGEPPDVLSDLYAVGAIIYRLITGMTPLQAMTKQPVSRLHEIPAPSALIPGVDPSLDDVLLSALSADPGERPISARIFTNTIAAIFEELELIASPSGVVRAVAATDARSGATAPIGRAFEKTAAEAWEKTQTDIPVPRRQVPAAYEEAETTDVGKVIVSPSILESGPELTTGVIETAPGGPPTEATRDLAPITSILPNRTVLERSRRGNSQAVSAPRPAESATQSKKQTSLIYGHPFFRQQEDLMDDAQEEISSEEATHDVMPFALALQSVQSKARFARAVFDDASERLGRKWRRLGPEARRWGLIACGASAVASMLLVLLLARHPAESSVVEVVGEPTVAVAAKAAPAPVAPAPAPAAPAPAPVPVQVAATPSPTPIARPAETTPRAAPAATKVAKPAAKPTKVSKKALAKKKAAAKRAAARRHAR